MHSEFLSARLVVGTASSCFMVRGWRELAARWRKSSITRQARILTLQGGNVSLALAGGKGANLARLLGAGFSVPGGFIITTRAYHSRDSELRTPATKSSVAALSLRFFGKNASPKRGRILSRE